MLQYLPACVQGQQAAVDAALTQLQLTHESRKLATYADRYARLLYDVAQVNTWGFRGNEGMAPVHGFPMTEEPVHVQLLQVFLLTCFCLWENNKFEAYTMPLHAIISSSN